MKCRESEKIIETLFETALETAVNEEFKQHVKECSHCFKKLENMKASLSVTSCYIDFEPDLSGISEIIKKVRHHDENRISSSNPGKVALNMSKKSVDKTRINNKTYTPFFIAAAAAAILFLFFLPRNKNVKTSALKIDKGAYQCSVTEVKGHSTATDADEVEKNIALDEKIYSNTLVKTSRGASVSVRYKDNTLLKIKESTEIKFKFNSFVMKKGSTWLNVTKKDSKFVIETPVAVLGVLGTCFDVSVDKSGRTRVSLHEGSLQIDSQRPVENSPDNSRPDSIVLKAGNSVVITDQFKIEKPQPLSRKGFELFDSNKSTKKKSTWNK